MQKTTYEPCNYASYVGLDVLKDDVAQRTRRMARLSLTDRIRLLKHLHNIILFFGHIWIKNQSL